MSLRFDRFLVDLAGRRLLRDGAHIHLTPKAFELLLLLVDRRPAAVAKNAILEALWPGTFVLEANVANLVAEIRAALGDDSAHPKFVRTVPRFGYAFSGDVAVTSAAPAVAAAPGPAQPQAMTSAVAAAPSAQPLSPIALVGANGRLALPEGSTILGREGVAADLLNSPLVSRRHARVDVQGGRVFIEDLGSKNGCTVDGARISGRVSLVSGASIGIGPLLLTLVREDEESTKTFYGGELQGL